MTWLFLAIELMGVVQQQARADPRVVIVQATRAVEGDSSASVARDWTRQLELDSTDAAAALGLAALARLHYDYPTSDSLYARLIHRDRAGTDAYGVAARLELGRSFHVRGLNARADSQFAAAVSGAERAGLAGLEADALIALAGVRARTSGYAVADSLLRRTASRLAPDDLLARSHYHCARAALLQMTGRPNVESEARTGAELAGRAGAPRQQAYCLRVLAVSVINRDGIDEGFALLDHVVKQLSKVRDRAALASVLQWRGHHSFTLYEYGRARDDLLRAVAEGTESGAQSAVSWAFLSLGMLASSAGDVISARSYADSAATLFESQGDLWGLGALRALQGRVEYHAGDWVTARVGFEDALEAANAIGYAPNIVAVNVGLALLDMDEADLKAAEYHLNSARDATIRHQMDAWERGLSYHFARLAMLNGHLDVAERELRSVYPAGPAVDTAQPAVAYARRSRLADVLMRQGRIADAETELRHATDALDSVRSGLTDQQLRAIVLGNLRQIHDPDLGTPRVLAGVVANGRAESAFILADRRKARHMLERVILRDALRGRAADIAAPIAPKRYVSPAVTMADVSAALPERTALLEYVTGADGAPTTLFIITRSAGTAIVLPALDSIAGDIRRFITLIEEGVDPTHLARSLGNALLDGAIARLPATVSRLVIVPDAGLNRVPFDALASIEGRMVERFSISIAPSAGMAIQLWERPVNSSPVELLALGDPTRDVPAMASAHASDFIGGGVLERLPASGRESRMVARYAPAATVRLREQASEAWLKRATLRRFRVLHFAAHALVDEQTPMRTALVLSAGDGDDGFIQGGDLAALDLDADLVVLSACRTAGGAHVHGEGVEGLTGPLLEAGARAVVASLWRVGDRATADFIRTFYDALAAGQPTGEALTAAKREALQRGQPPAVWAAFTLVGDPDVRIPLQRPASRTRLWIVSIALIVAIGYGALMRRSRSVDRTRTPSDVTASTHQRSRSRGKIVSESDRTSDVSD